MHFSPPTHKKLQFPKVESTNFYNYTIFGLQNNTVEQNRFSDTIVPEVLDTNRNTLRKTPAFPIT